MNDSSDVLRKRAERLLGCPSPSSTESRAEESLNLVYELNVHQAELEMQNDELRKTQQALVESRDRFLELFELAPVTYLTVNSAGLITEANSKAEELFEVERNKVVGSSLASYCSSESADRLYLCIRKGILESQKICCELDLKEGLAIRNVRLDAVQATNGKSQSGVLRIVITDITAQKQMAAIQAEHLHAVQREKISALGLIAGGVAHDFNNLLTPIILHAEFAAQDVAIQPSTKRGLQCIVDAAENAAGICKTLLELAGNNQLDNQPIPFSLVVREKVEFLTASLPSNVKLTYKHDAASTNILGEPNKIQRLLTNLLSNSIEAIGDTPGSITVETTTKYFTKADLSRMTFATNAKAGRFACVSIADNGCGMDQETIANIFDAFFSTKLYGRGLGMSSVVGVIRDHYAAINVSSEKQAGTTIVALFPTTDRKIAPVQNHTDIASSGSGTVLVVDDNEMVRESFLQLLNFSGFSTLSAASGSEAIEIVKAWNDPIDVVLLDLVMPEMNGVQTLIGIREIESNMPIVIATGYAEGEMLDRLNSHAIQGFITKPCSIGTLSTTVKLAIESAIQQLGQ